MDEIHILKPTDVHIKEIERIHLSHFQQIGQVEGEIASYLKRPENLALISTDKDGVVTGYIISANYGTQNYFEWFAVSKKRQGIAQALFNEYLKELKLLKMTSSALASRNRFKDAIIFYLKSGYEIKGVNLANDGDLMINLKLSLT